MADPEQVTRDVQAPDGKTYPVTGPKGASEADFVNALIEKHPHLGDPELAGFDPEKTTGEIYKQAGKAFFPSA